DEGDDLQDVALCELLVDVMGALHHGPIPLDGDALGADSQVAQKIRYRQTVRKLDGIPVQPGAHRHRPDGIEGAQGGVKVVLVWTPGAVPDCPPGRKPWNLRSSCARSRSSAISMRRCSPTSAAGCAPATSSQARWW